MDGSLSRGSSPPGISDRAHPSSWSASQKEAQIIVLAREWPLQACVRGARRPPPPRSWPALPPAALVQGPRPQPARAAASGEARPRALGSVSAYYLHIYFTSSVQPNLRPLILMRGDDSDDELVKHSASPCAVCSLRLMSP